MTADPIQAAKERLTEFVAKPGLLTFGPYGSAHYNEWISAILAELSRLEGALADSDEARSIMASRVVEVCRERDEARREIAERDEALNEAADALEDGAHELERAHSQTFARAPMTLGELREEILRVADSMKTIATHRVRALLSKGSEEPAAPPEGHPELPSGSPPEAAVGATAALAGALTVLDQLSDALFELQERAEGWSVSGVYFTEPCFSENVAAIAKAEAAERARADFYRTVQPRALVAAEPAVGEKS